MRLVFPITVGYIVLLLGVFPLFDSVFPLALAPTLKAGFLIGYMIYDLLHYFMHHSSPKDGYLKSIKLYHM